MEDWKVDYHYRKGEDQLEHTNQSIQLPDGYYDLAKKYLIENGEKSPFDIQDQGVMYQLNNWGVELLVLRTFNREEVSFDLPQGTARREQITAIEASTGLDGKVRASGGEPLEDTKVIGSEEHPFRLYAPTGELMGTYTTWNEFCTKAEDEAFLEEIKRIVSF